MSHLAPPDAPTVVAIIQAGGKGSRMNVLTRDRAKPALPFAGTHQLIDIAMSNLANSGIDDVWVSVQYQADSLDRHLQHGRPWDLDRNRGGYRRLVPQEGGDEHRGGFSRGNADDLYRVREQIRAASADVTIVLSADQVFRLDLRAVVHEHVAAGADCTIVTTEVSPTEAANKAVVTLDSAGQVRRIEDKPDHPSHGVICAEVFVYRTDALLRALDAVYAERSGLTDDEDDTGMGDFAEYLLPWMIDHAVVRSSALDGYWQDMGRPETYLRAHRDLVKGRIALFDDPQWPMRTLATNRCGARLTHDATVVDSLLSPGVRVEGTVRGCVLGPGVVVRKGATVVDSVIMDDVVIGADAQVVNAIVDERVVVRAGAVVGAPTRSTRVVDDHIAVLGHDCAVGGSAHVSPGEVVEPGADRR